MDERDGTSSIEVTGTRRFRVTDSHAAVDDLNFGLSRTRVTVLDDSIHDLEAATPEYDEAVALQALLTEKMVQWSSSSRSLVHSFENNATPVQFAWNLCFFLSQYPSVAVEERLAWAAEPDPLVLLRRLAALLEERRA